jgi:hypothetical protein
MAMAYDKRDIERKDYVDANRDIITGAPGAHPVGTGLGAAAGGMAAGAAVGTVAGPVGTVVGAAVGAVVGGLAGKAVAESIDPTVEDAFWQENYRTRPYVETDASYDDYGPAYRYGVDTWRTHGSDNFDVAEPELAAGWERDARRDSRLGWDRARHAVRDSWSRFGDSVERAIPGDTDGDGR